MTTARKHKPPSARAGSSSGGETASAASSSRFRAVSGVAAVAVVLAAIAAALWLRWFPSTQRCPPAGDRFHEHCKEGRQHYLISIDWACLGQERSAVMRQALGLEGDAANQGRVPSWLSAAHAEVVRKSPCVQDVRVDLGCWHCAPTPRTPLQQAAAAESAAAAAERAAAAGSDEPAQQTGGR